MLLGQNYVKSVDHGSMFPCAWPRAGACLVVDCVNCSAMHPGCSAIGSAAVMLRLVGAAHLLAPASRVAKPKTNIATRCLGK